MNEEPNPNLADRAVELLAQLLDAVGLNGTRLRWRWRQKRLDLAERGMGAEVMLRSARGKHKMCRSCRALVPRSASVCPECETDLRDVRAPGVGRFATNLLPGVSTASSLLMLVNGFWFALTIMAHVKSGGGGGLFAFFGGEMLVNFGSGNSWLVLHAGEWWRLITPIFLHGGLIHFGFNMYVLLQLGPVVEEEFGLERFWVLYLAAGISGSLASQIVRFFVMTALDVDPRLRYVNTVGASGAIFGMMGLLIVYGWRIGGARGNAMKSGLLRWLFYIVIFSVLVGGGIDHFNHLGGFVFGGLAALVVAPPRAGERTGRGWRIASLAGVLSTLR